MRDPKELVAEVDSSIAILIGMLLLPLGISLTPTEYIVLDYNSTDSCMVESLEPAIFLTFVAIAFINGALISSKFVKASFTKPSLMLPLKIKVLACAAYIFIAFAHILSMIVIFMTCEVKLKKIICLPNWMRMTFIMIGISVIVGYFCVLYAWIVGGPDDAHDAIATTTHPAASCITHSVAPSTVAPVAPPTTRSTTSITTPFVASHTASIARPAASDH